MSVKISLNDNTIHELCFDVTTFSDLKSNESGDVNHLSTNQNIFNKIKEFVDHYSSLSKKDKKIFESPDQHLWINNYFENLSNSDLIELMNESSIINMKPLINICCYKLSIILNNASNDEITKIFKLPDNTSKLTLFNN